MLKLSLSWEKTNARKLSYLCCWLKHKRLLALPLQLWIPSTKDDAHSSTTKAPQFTHNIAGITITVTIGTLRSWKAWPNKLVFFGNLCSLVVWKNTHSCSFELWIIAISRGMDVVFILFLYHFNNQTRSTRKPILFPFKVILFVFTNHEWHLKTG